MATNQELLDKQASGAVLSPLEHAQLNGDTNTGSSLQGTGASPYVTSLLGGNGGISNENVLAAMNQATASIPTQPASVTPAVTPAAGSGNSSGGNRYLYDRTVGGQYYDMSPAGQVAYVNAVHQANLTSSAKALTDFSTKQNNGLARTAADYATAKAGFGSAQDTIDNQALSYAKNYANQGVALENSHGTNLAQIAATYSAASPLAFQSSQAADTSFANAQYAHGVQALNDQRDSTVGNGYILGTNDDGSLKLGSLGNKSSLGIAQNTNAGQSAAADTNYNLYTANAAKELNSEKQAENISLNSQQDQTVNDLNRTNAFAGNQGIDFGKANYTGGGPQSMDLSMYTNSPLTASAAGSVPGANYANYAAPPGAANQTDGSKFLGYAPNTTQGGYLSQFLKAGNVTPQG